MDLPLLAAWILLGLSAAVFALAGAGKAFAGRSKMIASQPWMNDFSDQQVRLIGAVELIGAIGLIVPFATGILPWLTPLAGVGLIVVMVGAMVTHARRREWKNVAVNVVLAILVGAAAYAASLAL